MRINVQTCRPEVSSIGLVIGILLPETLAIEQTETLYVLQAPIEGPDVPAGQQSLEVRRAC